MSREVDLPFWSSQRRRGIHNGQRAEALAAITCIGEFPFAELGWPQVTPNTGKARILLAEVRCLAFRYQLTNRQAVSKNPTV